MRTGNSSQITCFGGEKKAKTKQYGGHTDFCLKGEHGGAHLSASTQILRRRGREDEPGTILSYCGSGREQEDQVQRKCTRPYAKLAAHYRLPSKASRLAFQNSPLDKLFQSVNKTSPQSTLHSSASHFQDSC